MSDIESVEPTVLPPEDPSEDSRRASTSKHAEPIPRRSGQDPEQRGGRFSEGGVVAGLLLDAADAVTLYGWMGMLLGGAIGLYLCYDMKLPPKRWGWVIAIAGIYCALPGTRFVPAGTLFMLGRSMLAKLDRLER